MMKFALGLIACAALLAAQDATGLRGAYRFAYLTWSDGAKLAAASQGGTLSFDGAGKAQWGEASGTYAITEPHTASLAAGGVSLSLRFNQDAGILIGSAAEAGPRHHLLVAVRAAEGLGPRVLSGTYGVAALAVRDAATAGLATSFAQLTANGAGQFTRAILTGHAARIDDVNRREERTGLTYELGSDGMGLAHFGAGSDVLNGDLALAVSADGSILIGWSADAANPAILLGVRKIPEAAAFSFRGRFWLAEMLAENSFVFQQSTRLSSASGSLASGLVGVAYLSQHLLAGGETTWLATTNQYRAGSDGSGALGPKLEAGVDNFAFNEAAFVAAQTGAPGQLTLAHGIVFGMAAPPMLPVLSSAAAPLTPDAPVSPGSLMTLTGAFGAAPEAVRVHIDGAPVPVSLAAPDRIHFQVPASLESASPVTIEVLVNGSVTQTLRARRAASAPVLFTAESNGIGPASAAHSDGSPVTPMKPAEPGEMVTLTAAGVGPAPTLRVLFDGQPGEVASVKAVDGQPGRYRIVVTVPRDLVLASGAVREIPIALATPDAFVDLADLLVIRRAAE